MNYSSGGGRLKIFPDPERRDDIKFLFMKGIPYNMRLALIVSCMVAGLMIQLFYSFLPGLILLALATAIGLVRGYDLKIEAKNSSEKWNQVTPDEYKKVKAKQKDLARWDLDAFDITNPLGGAVFVILGIAAVLIWLVLQRQPGHVSTYWALDCLVLLIPHWITGVKGYLKQDRLIIKIKLLEEVMGELARPSYIQVLPMLATQATQEDRRFPTDARLMLRLIGAPAAFLGIQIQISINSVQGTDYPYLYCVLLARNEAGLFAGWRDIVNKMPEFRESILPDEPRNEEGVDILVIRQKTTQTSGYHTKPDQAISIVTFAVKVARRFCNIG
jgi:hypothetical protein